MKTLLLALLLMVPLLANAESLADIEWMSEQYPPYNYVDNEGTPKGITFEVLFRMFDRIDHNVVPRDVQFLPWARSFRALQRKPKTAVFSISYTPERKNCSVLLARSCR